MARSIKAGGATAMAATLSSRPRRSARRAFSTLLQATAWVRTAPTITSKRVRPGHQPCAPHARSSASYQAAKGSAGRRGGSEARDDVDPEGELRPAIVIAGGRDLDREGAALPGRQEEALGAIERRDRRGPLRRDGAEVA